MNEDSKMPRPEHPRPQFFRENWINLNGTWEFLIDRGKSGKDREFYKNGKFDKNIIVPFCPESVLSSIGYVDFMPCVWYRRAFLLPENWNKSGRVILHFGAVNYLADIWINNIHVGSHKGGYSSFEIDITDSICSGENILVVCAENDLKSGTQPSGKQARRYKSSGCFYTRTTGIWQTVWLEHVANSYVSQCKFTEDIANEGVQADLTMGGEPFVGEVELSAYYEQKLMGRINIKVDKNSHVRAFLKLEDIHLWQPGEPKLYDVTIRLLDRDTKIDQVSSYFGLRRLFWDQKGFYINGKTIYKRLVLDQGFYPDGVITAPSDEDLKLDIVRAMKMGFNGARMHQKVFEQRYIYWADRLGFLLWGEHGSWGLDIRNKGALNTFLPEWMEIVERDYSSPAIVCWCPFNESQMDGEAEIIANVYKVTKKLDTTRPVIDASGWMHTPMTDIFDYHDYEEDPEKFSEHLSHYANSKKGKPFAEHMMEFTRPIKDKNSPISRGQPVFISEFGGIGWDINSEKNEDNWGYGQMPKSAEEFLERFSKLVKIALSTEGIIGFCYTQLTDVEQEKNGLHTFQREPKFSTKKIRKIITAPAWNEK